MPKVLTQQQIEQYHEQGFISPIRVMPENEALSIAAEIERVEREFPEEIHAKSRNNLHLSFTFFDQLAHNKVIVDAMEDIIGPDISLWASVLFAKDPNSKHYVSWHQDATYMGLSSNDFATPWIALTPSNENTGCMMMIPGSHKNAIQNHEDTFAANNILTRGQVIQEVDESQAVNLILEPGEMSIHCGTIIHGSKENKSNQRRVGFALQSYVGNHIKQIVGKEMWTYVRGQIREDVGITYLHRPQYDMDYRTVSERKLADENLSNILYKGSKIKRNY
tara:strand:+ start:926 stop:1759 length:834 start_codon:yes stop_codon:yes gene_type:complete